MSKKHLTQKSPCEGLVAAGLVAQFSAAYWAVSGVAVAFQMAMIALVWILHRRHFARPAAVAMPAE